MQSLPWNTYSEDEIINSSDNSLITNDLTDDYSDHEVDTSSFHLDFSLNEDQERKYKKVMVFLIYL